MSISDKKLNPKSLVILDLDGTMVDSVPDLAASVDHMMTQMGLSPCGEDEVRGYVGNGAQRLIERALTGDMNAKPDAQQYQRAQELFFAHYSANVCRHSRLYPGTQQALQQLHERGCKLACVTNKPEMFTVPLLEELSVARYFGLIVSGDSLPKKKPDPLPLLHTAQKLGASVEQTAMVGDSSHDVAAARAAGMDCIAVTYGYNHGEDIALSRPDIVIDSLCELTDIIETA